MTAKAEKICGIYRTDRKDRKSFKQVLRNEEKTGTTENRRSTEMIEKTS